MTSRADKAGTTSYTYDEADRLATVADPLTGSALTYGYNADSAPTTISYAKGGTAGPKQALGYSGLQQLDSDKLTSASGATIASASPTPSTPTGTWRLRPPPASPARPAPATATTRPTSSPHRP